MLYKILIIGNLSDNHMIRFVKNLKIINPRAQIYVLDEERRENNQMSEISPYIEGAFFIKLTDKCKGIPIIKTLLYISNWKIQFSKLLKNCDFDIINIHYPSYQHRFVLNDILNNTRHLVLTPWGSDVYRIGNIKRALVKKVYDSSDVVTGAGDRFTMDFMRIFNIDEHKFRLADMGSETIDYISRYQGCTSESESKKRLGLGNNYVITCGYNASTAQRHIAIIDAINSIKERLPSNLILLFPVTYPKSEGYITTLKKKVSACGLKAVFYETYLDIPRLFDLRQAADLFIHIQTTDANCSTLREYLLCNKKVINGGWLSYDDLEKYGMPYFTVNNIDELSNVILKAYTSDNKKIDERIILEIKAKGCSHQSRLYNNIFEELKLKVK